MAVRFLARQLGHRYGFRPGRGRFSVSQELASIGTLGVIRTPEEFAETPRLQFHLRPTLVAGDYGTIVTLYLEFSLFYFESGTIRIVATYMELAALVNQVAVHGRRAQRASSPREQLLGFYFVVADYLHFVSSDQVNRALAALLYRKVVAGTTQKNPGSRRSNHHRSTALRARNVDRSRLVLPHRSGGVAEVFLEFPIKPVQRLLPVQVSACDGVQLFFETGCEIVIHDLVEVFDQPFCDDFTHLFGIKALVFHSDVAPVLNGRNYGGVGRRSTDTPFLELSHQAGFVVSRRRIREVPAGEQFD